MTKSKSNRDEARDAIGVRHGASEHKRGKSWKGLWRGLQRGGFTVAWSSGLRKRVGNGGGRSFRFSEQNGEPLERFEERMSGMI